MREIKFRAWDNQTQEMLTGAGVLPLESSITYSRAYSYDQYDASKDYPMVRPPHARFRLMQYTGLKDKNGVECFESDIIRFNYGFEGECIEEVFWDEEGAKFVHTYSDRPSKAFWANRDFEFEVVGNIYVNPELLK
jgi:uncharacterized phage protein (TIGR01671 family)